MIAARANKQRVSENTSIVEGISGKKGKALQQSFSARILLILSVIFFSFPTYDVYAGNGANTRLASCNTAPDIIYHNGTIITMDPANAIAEAIAIKADTIVAVGPDAEILALVEPGCGTQLVDLQGLTVLPGFNESHSHWFSWREHICSVSGETTYPALEEIMQMLSANGWTSISELNFGRPDFAPEHLNNALDLDARGELSVRLNGYWGTLDDVSLLQVLADSMRTPGKKYSDRVRATGVKMYVDDPFGTTDILTQQQTNDLVQAAHTAGWQVAAHAVNESAVEKILTAYENVLAAESNENYRHRIEHAVKVSDAQLNRMKQKGIIASFQLLGPPDWPNQTTFQTYISNSHTDWVLRWKDFVGAEASGLHVTGSTDAPFNDSPCDYSPFRVIYQAVTRQGYLDRTHAAWELAQRLTVEECLKLLTIDGAYATFEEDEKGSLTPGKWADLVMVSENPLAVPTPEDLLNIDVYLTMVGGEIEYCDDTANGDLCSPAESFIVGSNIITASRYLPDQTPDLAFDNSTETNWGAGDGPPQWIQIELPEELAIGAMELVIDQWPAGHTVHQIWAKSSDTAATFELLHEFSGNTAIDQVLTYTAPSDLDAYRYFRILSTESPSWISWREIRILERDVTSVDENDSLVPSDYALAQNYPNPFNPSTTITYGIPSENAGQVVYLEIYNLRGQMIRTLVREKRSAGYHSVQWDGTDFSGTQVSSGLYLYKLRVGSFLTSKKMLFLK